ncbi:MAG: AMP-binding protein [Verrucomicrobia bacterium]|nr:AMP-binding protein [Verrucomicrobiota bacterium]
MKLLLRFLLRVLFGFRAYRLEALQTPGPVLLVPNHVSWIDWLFLGVCLEPDWRFVTSLEMVHKGRRWIRPLIDNRRTFPVDTLSPYAVRRMAEYLQRGGRLVLFAEGRLSRTGTLMKLFDGTGFLLHKTRARVITAYLRGAQRLPLSPNRGRKRWFPRVTVHFGTPSAAPDVAHLPAAKARTLVTNWLRDRLLEQQFETEMAFGPGTVPEAILATARVLPKQVAFEDVQGTLPYRRLLAGAGILARQWDRLLGADARRVGVLLPNVSGMPVVLLSLWLDGRVPAVMNYSAGAATMQACARLAGLEHLVTSRAFLKRTRIDPGALSQAGLQVHYLEDVRQTVTAAAKLAGLCRARVAPRSLLRRRPSPADPAVILFTSGSEGAPKGVELTHTNLLANVRQILAVTDIQDTDRLFAALPLFHSFGLTVGALLPLMRGIFCFLYVSPLHYRVVPTLFYDRDCTILVGTNTFLNGYARKAHPYDFRSLRYLFAGAEKLQETTATTWARRFGVRVLEGYGATECSPCISVCTPLQPRHGSAGRLLPGIQCRLAPVEGVSDGGRLLVKGPNVMRGYLNPEANTQFQALDGWYDTGDIARLDADGFLTLLGRLKRFAKISGEMVSLTAVEDALAGAFPHYGLRCQIAVLSQPDPDKGEVLIAVSNESRLSLDEIRAALRARGLPNLCAPREVRFVKDIPTLGTGKVNHRELAALIAPVAPPAASP